MEVSRAAWAGVHFVHDRAGGARIELDQHGRRRFLVERGKLKRRGVRLHFGVDVHDGLLCLFCKFIAPRQPALIFGGLRFELGGPLLKVLLRLREVLPLPGDARVDRGVGDVAAIARGGAAGGRSRFRRWFLRLALHHLRGQRIVAEPPLQRGDVAEGVLRLLVIGGGLGSGAIGGGRGGWRGWRRWFGPARLGGRGLLALRFYRLDRCGLARGMSRAGFGSSLRALCAFALRRGRLSIGRDVLHLGVPARNLGAPALGLSRNLHSGKRHRGAKQPAAGSDQSRFARHRRHHTLTLTARSDPLAAPPPT